MGIKTCKKTIKMLQTSVKTDYLTQRKEVEKIEKEIEKIEDQIAEKRREFDKKNGIDKLLKKIGTLENKQYKLEDQIHEFLKEILTKLADGYLSDDFFLEEKKSRGGISYKSISEDLLKQLFPNKTDKQKREDLFEKLKDKYGKVKYFYDLIFKNGNQKESLLEMQDVELVESSKKVKKLHMIK